MYRDISRKICLWLGVCLCVVTCLTKGLSHAPVRTHHMLSGAREDLMALQKPPELGARDASEVLRPAAVPQ